MNLSPNVLSVGDRVECCLYPPDLRTEHDQWFDVKIVWFGPSSTVCVAADPISIDPMVENEFIVPFSYLRRKNT
jgi:hypothetical protein